MGAGHGRAQLRAARRDELCGRWAGAVAAGPAVPEPLRAAAERVRRRAGASCSSFPLPLYSLDVFGTASPCAESLPSGLFIARRCPPRPLRRPHPARRSRPAARPSSAPRPRPARARARRAWPTRRALRAGARGDERGLRERGRAVEPRARRTTMSSSAKGCAIYPRLFPCHSSRARRENRIPVNLDERRAGRSRSPRRQTYRARACPIGPSSRASHPLHVPAAESARQRWEAGPLSSASPSTRLRRRRTLSALCATVEFSFGRASWGSSCAPSLCAARSDNHGEQRDEELCVAGKSETSAGTSSPACRPLVLLTSRFAR